MEEKAKIEKCVIQSILNLYGLDSNFSEQKEYINYYEEYGYKVKFVLSVLLESGQRVVIKIVSKKAEKVLEESQKIERQSAFSELMRKSGIITPQYYMANEKYCNVYVYNNIPCSVTVEDWCGEEITEINTDLAYKIGELMGRMHTLSLKNKWEIGCGTLFSAAYKNDVSVYEEFCEICENEYLDQGIIEQIKKLHDEKLEAIRAVWDTLPKAAVQGDISINNLVYGEKELTVFDYNNAGDEVLISDLILEGLLTAYEMELPEGKDHRYREQLFQALLDGYLSIRKLSSEEVDVAWTIYTLYHSLWFSRIVYFDNSLEKFVNNKDYTSANHLLRRMISDMNEIDDGRFKR